MTATIELDLLRKENRELREELALYRAADESLPAAAVVSAKAWLFDGTPRTSGLGQRGLAKMLLAFLRQPGKILSKYALEDAMDSTSESGRVTLTQMCKLRRALIAQGFPDAIETCYSYGYRMSKPVAQQIEAAMKMHQQRAQHEDAASFAKRFGASPADAKAAPDPKGAKGAFTKARKAVG